jgi:hypothetical protein
MSKTFLLCLATLCLWAAAFPLRAQPDAGWFALSPLVTSMDDLEFISDHVGCVVGRTDSLAVSLTTDGGASWQLHNLGPSAPHARVDIRDADHAWVLADGGNLHYTLDGGANWSAVPFPLPSGASGSADVAFPSDDAVYIASLDQGVLIKSTDLGITWDTLLTSAPASAWAKIDLLAFANADTGIYCPDFVHLLLTTDGGATWDTLLGAVSASDYDGIRCWDNEHCMTFLDGMHHQLDLGSLTVTLRGPHGLGCFWDFVDADTGYGGAATPAGTTWSTGSMHRTTDGGVTRALLSTSYTDMYNGPIDFTSNLVGYRLMEVMVGAPTYCLGPYGQLLKTTVGAVSAAEPGASASLRLHPNPTQGMATLQSTLPMGDALPSITDMNGRLWQPSCRRVSPLAWEMDVSGLPAGIYVVQVEQEGKRSTTKLVVH